MSRLISDESASELAVMAVSKGLLAEEKFSQMKVLNKESGQSMVSIMFEKGVMDEFSLARFVADSYGLNFREVDPEQVSAEAQAKLNEEYLRINNVCPFETDGSSLKVAICDHSKLSLEKNIRVITGMNVEMVLVTVSNFEKLLTKYGISPTTQEVGVLGTLKKAKDTDEGDAEVEQITERDKTAAEIQKKHSMKIKYYVGTMIELPRAAIRAKEIAKYADFFSFGTNDLTQTTFGISRDDSGKFLNDYVENKIFNKDPFVSIDERGVGELIKIATERGRLEKKTLKLGICGEHGGDPSSIEFCENAKLNYVSCSPYRVPIARLSAAQAYLKKKK